MDEYKCEKCGNARWFCCDVTCRKCNHVVQEAISARRY